MWSNVVDVDHSTAVVQRAFIKQIDRQVLEESMFKLTKGATGGVLQKRCKACNFIKKALRRMCFPLNFTKFLGISFSQNSFGQLFLN